MRLLQTPRPISRNKEAERTCTGGAGAEDREQIAIKVGAAS